jgi:D-sedoheptulose 7-phosphate isomerase
MEGCNPTRTNPNQQEKKMSNETVSGSSLRDNVEELRALLIHTEELQLQVAGAANALGNALLNGGKLLACGNGGSAADASHLTTEYVCRFSKDRRPYPAISLATHGGDITAIGNDYCFEDLFARQVEAFGRSGDVLMAFTTSGRSENVRRALLTAKRLELRTVAFLGGDGGVCTGLAEIELLVRSTTPARVQEIHKLLLHTICEILETRL